MDDASSEPVSPWANGFATVASVPPCRRSAVRARGCWVYCDRQRPTIWPEHQHESNVQVLVSFERADCVARWKLDGSLSFSEKSIQAGQVWILPPGIRHEIEWRREADLIKLHLESRWARESAGQDIKDISVEALDHYVRSAPIIGELCGLLRLQGRTRGPLNEPLVSGLGAALATQLMASHFQEERTRHPQHWLLPRPILADVCTYIDAHLTEKLTLPALARVAGLSQSYFGQMFRAALGMSPMTYVLDQRVLRAREMLRRGKANVAEVAHAVGFSDQHQMNRHFRRLLHTPPSAYRPPREQRK
jgi:AraC family transcriptional regulator